MSCTITNQRPHFKPQEIMAFMEWKEFCRTAPTRRHVGIISLYYVLQRWTQKGCTQLCSCNRVHFKLPANRPALRRSYIVMIGPSGVQKGWETIWFEQLLFWRNEGREVTVTDRSICVTVHPKKYAHGFVVLCFVVVMQSFIMYSHEVFIHIHQGCFAGTGAIVRLS